MEKNACLYSPCRQYEKEESLILLTLKHNEYYSQVNNTLHSLFFIIQGNLSVHFKKAKKDCEEGDIFLIPQNYEFKLHALSEKCEVICLRFNEIKYFCSICDNSIYKEYENYSQEFIPVKMNIQMKSYTAFLQTTIAKDVPLCKRISSVYRQVISAIFYQWYSKKEIYTLFYPILGEDVSFRVKILSMYSDISSVAELAQKTGWGQTSFKQKFKKEFGTTPLKWLQSQKAEAIKKDLANHRITLKMIIDKYHFSTHNQLCNFCRFYFKDSPSNLKRKLQNKN